MRPAVLAERYARALFEISKEAANTSLVLQELQQFASAFTSDEQLQLFSQTPLVKAADKEAALASALSKQKLSETTQNFVLLLAQKGRLALIAEISSAFQDQINSEAGITPGIVRSAVNLSDSQKKEINETLNRITGKKVELQFEVDERLAGGITAQVGSLTIDDSLSSHLKRMQDELNRRTH